MGILIGLIALAVLILYRKQIITTVTADIKMLRLEPKKWAWLKWKEWGEPFVVAIVLALIIRTYLIGPYKIPTGSMETTLMIGDRIFVDKITYRFREPKRGEVIVFKYPIDRKKDFVKRLIAFGGEEVEIRDGSVYVNGEKLSDEVFASKYYYNRSDWDYGRENQIFRVPQDTFFVLGDNSGHSSDSRNWGFVPKKDLIGRTVVVWWPINRMGIIE